MSSSILVENEQKRLSLSLPWLCCFALFTAWQVGVFSYSGAALAVTGRLPLGIDAENLTPLISLGYVFSIIWMLVFPARIVWAERIMAGTALLSTLALYLPLSRGTTAAFFLIQLFCCCVMIGFETAIIVGLFSEASAVKHLLVAYGLIFIPAALMQAEFFAVPYWVFQHFNAAALVLQLLFYWKLPAGVWPRYAQAKSPLSCPKRLFAGLFALCFLGNIVFSFGISAAEGVAHGVFVFYVSSSAFAISGYALLRRLGLSPLRYASISVMVSVAGFILAIVALYIPALALLSCVLLGPGTAVCILIPYYGVVMTKRYPSRLIAPLIIGISFAASVLLLAWLIEAFRANTTLLYTLYLAIAVAMAVLYLALEPYLLYSFRGRPLISDEEIAGIARTEAPLSDRQRNLIAGAFDRLSVKELAIAELLMQGFKYEVICARLGISKNTAYWYRRQLFDKLQIGSLQELFALAEKRGQGEAAYTAPENRRE
ncbi:MAG: helix-turn-helix transcriptional regulator [Spirochaetaceae bacterium]|jgi:DNA-binding CsgD family transcriptional regulator|nr:helix-turn-helix transcriptional regulator [Spirochaetaceae bacterium]